MSFHPRYAPPAPPVPPALEPSTDRLTLLAAATALAAAVAGQALIVSQPYWGLAWFAAAALLMVFVTRRRPEPCKLEPAPPPPLTPVFLTLVVVGASLCIAAGVLVYRMQPALLTHCVWAAGLVVLAAAAALGRTGAPALPVDRRTLLGGVAVAAVAAIVFGWRLTSLPVEVHGDDAEVGLDAIRLLANFNIFAAGWFELPRFHAFPTMLGLRVFGINLLGLRATSAALGVGSVVLLFAVARRLWSLEVAVVAGLLLAGQRFFIHLSRAGYHYVDTPFLSLLVLWLFLRVWQDRRRGALIWCGVALGLGIQTYYASRIVPLLLALTWLLWMVGTPKGEGWRRTAVFGVIVLVAGAVAAPIFGYFAHDWSAFWERTRDTSMFTAAARHHLAYGYHTDNLLSIVLIQMRAAVGVFNAVLDNSVQYGLRGPLLEPVSGALFILGVGWIVARLRERRAQLLVVWIALPLIVGAALTIDTPFYPRISGLVPFAVLAIAVALTSLLDAARAAVPSRTGRELAGALAVGAVALVSAENLRSYFVEYAAVYRHSPCVEIAAWVRAHGAGKTTYMIGSAPGFYIRHGAISFLTYGYESRDIENFEGFTRAQQLDPAKSLFVIMPHGTAVIPALEQAIGPITLQTHRNRGGEPAFLTAIPQGSDRDAKAEPADRFDQPRQIPGDLVTIGAALQYLATAARALLAAAGLAVLVLAFVGGARRPRRPGVSALAVPWRERLDGWRSRLFGPDPLEQRGALPHQAVIALLVVVLGAALALRVYHLADLPAGFFCDEAGNGYNAYSLLHTGRDEAGARLPLYVWSFGVSYKNPVFLYSAMLPMALLGPTELAVRLTAALWGFATVVAMFFLGRALMGATVGLIAALLLAVVPWHLHFSRIGFELITLPFFFTVAMHSLVRWTQGRGTFAQAMVLFALSLYTYVPAKLIVPLFLGGFALLYWRPLLARRRETALGIGLFVLTAAPVVIFDVAHHDEAGSYFRNTTLLARRLAPLQLARQFGSNYAAFFSREFLFESSNDKIIRHSVSDHGELYPFFAPLLVLGGVTALLRGDRAMRLPLLWLVLYPIAPALMNEIPSASRGIAGAPAFCLVAAIGAGAVFRLLARAGRGRAVPLALQGALAVACLALLIPAVARYWALYRDEYPLYSAKYYTGFQYGHRQVVERFRQSYDDYDMFLLTTRLSNQPEIFLRFYDGLRRAPQPDGVPPYAPGEKMHVGSPEAYEHYQDPSRRMLFAVLPEEVPLFADADVKERIIAPDGSAAFVLVSASRLKDFVSTWHLTGLLPEDDRSPPPSWTPENPPPDRPARRQLLYDRPLAGVGINDFFITNAEHACAWAVNFVTSPDERDVRVFAGFDDRGEVWVNGRRVLLTASGDPETSLVDNLTGPVHLNAGRNTIAVRTCEDVADWKFYFRLANPDGSPVEGLGWEYGPRAKLES